MATYREAPCQFYICIHDCKKGKKAEHDGMCQRCREYRARKGFRCVGNKKKRDMYKEEKTYEKL